MYDRVQRPNTNRHPSESTPSRFAPKPFVVPLQLDTNETPTPTGGKQHNNHADEESFPILRKMIRNLEAQIQTQSTVVQRQRQPEEAAGLCIFPDIQKIKDDLNSRKPESSTGLAATALTNNFAKEAYDFWQSNKDKPVTALSDFLMSKANELLPFECSHVYTTSGTLGSFDWRVWKIFINKSTFSKGQDVSNLGDLSQEKVAQIVDTIYHEARHSEQFFRIAQIRAGEGKSAETIVRNLSIPLEVAQTAVKSPLKENETNKALIEEGKGWEKFLSGKYTWYMAEVGKLNNQIEKMVFSWVGAGSEPSKKIDALVESLNRIEQKINKFFMKKRDEIINLKEKDKFDESVLKNIEGIISAFNAIKQEAEQQKSDLNKYDSSKISCLIDNLNIARYKAYRDFEHEKDAWAVGGTAKVAFKQLAGNKQ